MKDSLIAAIVLICILLFWKLRPEGFRIEKSFNSQIADLDALNKIEDGFHFSPSDYNQVDSKEIVR
jgi:hypothetical protein